MKRSTNIYQRLLCITAGASLLAIVGCSNLPGSASSNQAALYGTSDESLDSSVAYNPGHLAAGGGAGPSAAMGTMSAGGHGAATSSGATSAGGHGGGGR